MQFQKDLEQFLTKIDGLCNFKNQLPNIFVPRTAATIKFTTQWQL